MAEKIKKIGDRLKNMDIGDNYILSVNDEEGNKIKLVIYKDKDSGYSFYRMTLRDFKRMAKMEKYSHASQIVKHLIKSSGKIRNISKEIKSLTTRLSHEH